VTFSGGGGSGGAAYATVGSGTVVRSLGSSLSFYTPNQQIAFQVADYGGSVGTGYWSAYGGNIQPILTAIGSNSGVIQTTSAVPLLLRTGGIEQFRVAHTASAVNYVQVTGSSTTNWANISTQGSDSSISLSYYAKGAGNHIFATNNSSSGVQFRVLHAAGTIVNYAGVNGAVTGSAPAFSVAGTDTNISMAFQPKGTGAIDLAAGSSGVNISNGGTVTAITRTAAGSAYTTPPTVAISAPTTAGGVQATATVTIGLVSVTGIANGGTGYTVGNTLTVVGGTFTVACQVTVTTVSSGVITGVSVATGGSYTVAPTNPVSVTGGSGSGATFNLSFCIGSAFTITNAGSGYIEQPTITFSGGGGSGAAAYASIGTDATLRTIGQVLNLATDNGIGFRVMTSGQTASNYWQALSIGSTPALRSSGATASSQIQTGGTGALQFGTNSGVTQLQVSHTASAVNYVQVTGSATANIPIISTTGSDASVGMELRLKGTPTGPGFRVTNNNGSNVCFAVTTSGATPANYMRADPASASASPAMSAQGSDTDIDLTLTPKGTGLVRFGTYVAGALLATGYINIKAADGTTYKVLVST
jgi:hypothetical protein